MNKTKGFVIALLIIIIALLAYIAVNVSGHKTSSQTKSSVMVSTSIIDSKTGLTFPEGFSSVDASPSVLARYARGSEFIEISEKYENDPTCEKFFQTENFGFCVKGYHGEASSDELAKSFIRLNGASAQ